MIPPHRSCPRSYWMASNEIEDVNEFMVMPSSRKKPRKQLLNSALIRDDVPEMTIKVEPDLDNHIAVSFLWPTIYRVSHGKITTLRPPLELFVKIFSTIKTLRSDGGTIWTCWSLSHCYFTRLNLKKMGPLKFCLPAVLKVTFRS